MVPTGPIPQTSVEYVPMKSGRVKSKYKNESLPSAISLLIPLWLPWDLTPVSEVKSQHSTAERINLN